MRTVAGGTPKNAVFLDVVLTADMPGGAGREIDRETDASVAVQSPRVAALKGQHQSPAKITVNIAADQLLTFARPLGLDMTSARQRFRSDFKDVGEVIADQEFEIEAHTV